MTDEIDYPREYDNSGRVENAAELIVAYTGDAAAYREAIDCEVMDSDLAYGPKDRNKLDIVWPEDREDCPIVMFIHGGYWQRLDRSDFTHMASGLVERGCAVALPSYTLAPQARIGEIINEMRRACLLLYQTHGRKLTVVGHSAGGHLAACMLATDWQRIHRNLPEDLVCSGMGISGLYDLIPLTKTPVNDALQMDEASAHQASPVHWVPEGLQRFEAWVGSEESNEYHRQSRELAERWTMLGTPTTYVSVPSENHFTIIAALTKPDSDMVQTILSLTERPSIPFPGAISDDESPDDEEDEAETDTGPEGTEDASEPEGTSESGQPEDTDDLTAEEQEADEDPDPDGEVETETEMEPEANSDTEAEVDDDRDEPPQHDPDPGPQEEAPEEPADDSPAESDLEEETNPTDHDENESEPEPEDGSDHDDSTGDERAEDDKSPDEENRESEPETEADSEIDRSDEEHPDPEDEDEEQPARPNH